MAPWSVFDTCDCTATDAKFFGRYLRARATDMTGGVGGQRRAAAGGEGRTISRPGAGAASDGTTGRAGATTQIRPAPPPWGNWLPAGYSRPDGATQDTTRRCYLRGPDGVSGLAPSGTWSTCKIVPPGR